MEHSCVLVIPALNPPYSFVEYAASLKEAGFSRILVIDDGSRTDRLPVFMKLERMGCIILRHEQNQGQGAALKTGFRYYMEHFREKSDGIITLNTDRMVPVGDVLKVASSLHNEQRMGSYALVMGTRDFYSRRVTDYDFNMNKVMRLLYHMLMGVHLEDPLSGIFGIPDLRVQQCLDIPGDGYAYTTSLTMSFEKVGFLQVPVAYSREHRRPDYVRHIYRDRFSGECPCDHIRYRARQGDFRLGELSADQEFCLPFQV